MNATDRIPHHRRRMRGHGVGGGEPAIAWNELIKFKRTFTEPVPVMKERNFAKNGIEESSGRVLCAHVLGPHADEVINLFAVAMRAASRRRISSP